MAKLSLFTQSEKNPGQLDPWSIVFPVAFDLVCGILLIVLGDMASLVTAYALAGIMIIYAIWVLIKYVRSTTMEKIITFRLSGGLALRAVCRIWQRRHRRARGNAVTIVRHCGSFLAIQPVPTGLEHQIL